VKNATNLLGELCYVMRVSDRGDGENCAHLMGLSTRTFSPVSGITGNVKRRVLTINSQPRSNMADAHRSPKNSNPSQASLTLDY
jgi:hypothetical protein